MTAVRPCEIPASALLRQAQQGGAYADCYVTELAGAVSLPAFVEAFYTTALFKLERGILRWLVGRPSTDAHAKALAQGSAESFAAWRVEGRSADQLLLADFSGRTKSWLMVTPAEGGAAEPRTRLYFGSAVVPRVDARSGAPTMGPGFHALLGFHRLYSRLLLNAARSRLVASRQGSEP